MQDLLWGHPVGKRRPEAINTFNYIDSLSHSVSFIITSKKLAMTTAKTVIHFQEDVLQFNVFVPSCPVSRFSTILTISSVNLVFFYNLKVWSHIETSQLIVHFSVFLYLFIPNDFKWGNILYAMEK